MNFCKLMIFVSHPVSLLLESLWLHSCYMITGTGVIERKRNPRDNLESFKMLLFSRKKKIYPDSYKFTL